MVYIVGLISGIGGSSSLGAGTALLIYRPRVRGCGGGGGGGGGAPTASQVTICRVRWYMACSSSSLSAM